VAQVELDDSVGVLIGEVEGALAVRADGQPCERQIGAVDQTRERRVSAGDERGVELPRRLLPVERRHVDLEDVVGVLIGAVDDPAAGR
jgi:hypothetical protein